MVSDVHPLPVYAVVGYVRTTVPLPAQKYEHGKAFGWCLYAMLEYIFTELVNKSLCIILHQFYSLRLYRLIFILYIHFGSV
jgi:hypothetical protein